MEIGRQPISEALFNKLWLILYRELCDLYTTKQCDATTVYNTVYAICTNSNIKENKLENKLYWKIGDFMWNRCKEIYTDILECFRRHIDYLDKDDFINFYNHKFNNYINLVECINNLSIFLNECVKGKSIRDFGYILWEKGVIQELAESNIDVFLIAFSSNDHNRVVFINNLTYIVPVEEEKLLYYEKKYENIAIANLISKYSQVVFETDLVELGSMIESMVCDVYKSFNNYFLESSIDKVNETLERIIIEGRIYDIVNGYITLLFNEYKCKNNYNISIKAGSLAKYNLKEGLNKFTEEFYKNEIFKEAKTLIEQQINEDLNVTKSDNVSLNFFNQMGVLKNIRSILLKAYCIFIDQILKGSSDKISGSLE
ncbi:hypothetical protein A0H76_1624 [Hepatospora eriocheir]|uniref:Cullin N-terminal domain-containing protein n=1 Tax=Hepatospora eriocheir TaxID=1081669 RepID=A0A1X0QGR3_9MICR|nr:hypothetical protein A0H76_1624 [Hepatospora eriocheir]